MPLPSDELVQARLEKLESLRDRGVDPYPRNYERTHTAQEAIEHFESVEFSGEGESEVDHVSVGGRVTATSRNGQGHLLRPSLTAPARFRLCGAIRRRIQPSIGYRRLDRRVRSDDSKNRGASVWSNRLKSPLISRTSGCQSLKLAMAANVQDA